MRFTSALVAGALAVAVRAQTTTSDAPSTTTWSLDPVQSSILACINECDATDVNCLADCNPVPRPNETQAIDTIECVAKCDQGDGSPEDTQAYSDCSQKCINDNFFQDGQGTPTNSSNDSNTSANTATDSAATETGTNSDSPTESGSSSPTESNQENSSKTTTGSDSSSETPAEGDDEGAATTLVGSLLAGGIALILAL